MDIQEYVFIGTDRDKCTCLRVTWFGESELLQSHLSPEDIPYCGTRTRNMLSEGISQGAWFSSLHEYLAKCVEGSGSIESEFECGGIYPQRAMGDVLPHSLTNGVGGPKPFPLLFSNISFKTATGPGSGVRRSVTPSRSSHMDNPPTTNIHTIVKAQIVFLLSTLTEENFERNQMEIRSVS